MARTGAIRAGKAQVELSVDNSALVAGLRRAQAQLGKFAGNVKTVARGFAAAGGAISAPLAMAVAMAGSVGGALDDMNRRSGLSIEALSELGFAADRSGTDIGVVEKAAIRMAKTLRAAERGSRGAVDALADIGLTAADLEGLTPDEMFRKLAAGIAGIENPLKRGGVAADIFGRRAGATILPLLEDMDELTAEARRLGQTMSTEDAKAAATYGDAMDNLRAVLKRVAIEVGNALLPVLTGLSKAFTAAVVPAIAWVRENRYLVGIAAAVAAALLSIAGALGAVAAVALLAKFMIAGLIAAMSALAAVFGAIFSPIGLTVIAVALLAAGLAYLFARSAAGQRVLAGLGKTFRAVAARVAEFARAMWNALSAGNWQAAMELAQAGLLVVWTATKNKMLDIWHQFTGILSDAFWLALYAVREAWDAFAGAFEGRLLRIAKALTGLGGSFVFDALGDVREDLDAIEGLHGEAQDARRREDADRRRDAQAAEAEALARYRAALAAAQDARAESPATKAARAAAGAGGLAVEEQSTRMMALGSFSALAAKQFGRGQAFDQVVKETRRAADAAEGIENRLDNIDELAFA